MTPRRGSPLSLTLLLLALGAAWPGSPLTAAPARPVTVPDTPPGQRLTALLAAVNTGDRAALMQFVTESYAPPPTGALPVERIATRLLGLFESTGGLTLGQVAAASPTAIAAAVEARRTGYWSSLTVAVNAQPPHAILGTGLASIEAPAELLPRTRLTDREIRARIEALVSRLIAEDAFSGTILVARDGKPLYSRSHGLASRAWKRPNRLDTRFNLASITKMFTAVAVAQLVEQGKLSYQDTVGAVLPDYPNREVAQKVTVHHLLTHTSGIPDSGPIPDRLLATFRRGARTVKEYLPAFVDEPLKFAPGARFDYSNCGYVVLGLIIEKVAGQDYCAYVREKVFRPAGMAESDFYELDRDPPDLATGYMDAPGEPRRSNLFFLPVRGVPFSCAYASAGDLVKFAQALRQHRLLRPASLEASWRGRVDHTERGSQYGYGCIVKQYNGTRVVGHGGGWAGITNHLDVYPELGYTVVILNNIDSAPRPVAYKIREWLTQGRTDAAPSGSRAGSMRPQ